jgi:hypothetical protein
MEQIVFGRDPCQVAHGGVHHSANYTKEPFQLRSSFAEDALVPFSSYNGGSMKTYEHTPDPLAKNPETGMDQPLYALRVTSCVKRMHQTYAAYSLNELTLRCENASHVYAE